MGDIALYKKNLSMRCEEWTSSFNMDMMVLQYTSQLKGISLRHAIPMNTCYTLLPKYYANLVSQPNMWRGFYVFTSPQLALFVNSPKV